MISYILCYVTAFGLGMLFMGFVLYFLNREHERRQSIREHRKKQLRKDKVCHRTMI